MMRIRALRRRRTRGMAMVEMVFVLPVLLLVVFAIAEFGFLFSRWLTLSNAVREGARTAVVFRQDCDPATVAAEVKKVVKDYASAGRVQLDDDDITVKGHCTGSGNPTSVDAEFPVELNVPFASSLGKITLTYASTMRND